MALAPNKVKIIFYPAKQDSYCRKRYSHIAIEFPSADPAKNYFVSFGANRGRSSLFYLNGNAQFYDPAKYGAPEECILHSLSIIGMRERLFGLLEGSQERLGQLMKLVDASPATMAQNDLPVSEIQWRPLPGFCAMLLKPSINLQGGTELLTPVVDDEASCASMVHELLRAGGYESNLPWYSCHSRFLKNLTAWCISIPGGVAFCVLNLLALSALLVLATMHTENVHTHPSVQDPRMDAIFALSAFLAASLSAALITVCCPKVVLFLSSRVDLFPTPGGVMGLVKAISKQEARMGEVAPLVDRGVGGPEGVVVTFMPSLITTQAGIGVAKDIAL